MTASILALLSAHTSADAHEEESRQRTLRFLETTRAPCTRETLEGHITAAAIVLDPAGRALLLLHGRLGQWLQPGGHLEAGESPAEAALREAREESGLPDLQLEPQLLDVDVHPIPAHPRKPEPAHWHYDLCFIARTQQPASVQIDPNESRASRWVSAEEAEALSLDVATKRRLRKAFSRTR